mmetsp:Transcript_30709/g.95465  ORF Transcript_30709/g.95465 Transcript_30709/m.95465 type:complete len:88 (-) Transcript_30709:144-407(-)
MAKPGSSLVDCRTLTVACLLVCLFACLLACSLARVHACRSGKWLVLHPRKAGWLTTQNFKAVGRVRGTGPFMRARVCKHSYALRVVV